MTHKENPSFEEAHERLEKILASMNGNKISLEESLYLFEQAEKLMRYCEKQLKSAEQKIDQIVKGPSGETLLSSDNKPQIEAFAGEDVPF